MRHNNTVSIIGLVLGLMGIVCIFAIGLDKTLAPVASNPNTWLALGLVMLGAGMIVRAARD